MKSLRSYHRDKKGIQTILAALLMVVIVVVAAVMVYAWATGLLGTLLVHPTTGNEALTMNSFAYPSGTNTVAGNFNINNPSYYNVTLYLQNAGSVATTFTTYYVKNATGTTWTESSFGWAPTIQPNTVGTVYIGMNLTPTYGSYSTSSFGFVSGNSYTITLITSRNNQFQFTVTR
jgi:FlaG/FlaF family flagellin (archaellin)